MVTTANDKAVKALGSCSLGETTVLVSLGTYLAAMVHGRENRKTNPRFWTNFACMPHRYLDERPEDAPAAPIELPYDAVVGDLELDYHDEAELRETVTRAALESPCVVSASALS